MGSDVLCTVWQLMLACLTARPLACPPAGTYQCVTSGSCATSTQVRSSFLPSSSVVLRWRLPMNIGRVSLPLAAVPWSSLCVLPSMPLTFVAGMPRGFAFVEFNSIADSARALNMLQGAALDGQAAPIRLSYARDRGGAVATAQVDLADTEVRVCQWACWEEGGVPYLQVMDGAMRGWSIGRIGGQCVGCQLGEQASGWVYGAWLGGHSGALSVILLTTYPYPLPMSAQAGHP